MKKDIREKSFSYISQIGKQRYGLDKAKTTDINILLNRVKLTKKIEFKKRLIFLSLLILFITLVGILSLI
tara:strand:- start:130 stop:339 length:210 start_codon:yes stop_codon:yes gene_type:complete